MLLRVGVQSMEWRGVREVRNPGEVEEETYKMTQVMYLPHPLLPRLVLLLHRRHHLQHQHGNLLNLRLQLSQLFLPKSNLPIRFSLRLHPRLTSRQAWILELNQLLLFLPLRRIQQQERRRLAGNEELPNNLGDRTQLKLRQPSQTTMSIWRTINLQKEARLPKSNKTKNRKRNQS